MSTVRLRTSARAVILAGVALSALGVGPCARAQETSNAPSMPVVDLMLRQIRYWFQHGENDRVTEALAKLRRTAPGDPRVIEIEGEWAVRRGELGEAQSLMQRLAPRDAKAARRLASIIHADTVAGSQLNEAREDARAGRQQEAVALYRRIFPDGPPPDYALEYYHTLAGWTPSRADGLAGLRQMIRANPNDIDAQIAWSSALTWREPSRAEGLQRFRRLAGVPGLSGEQRHEIERAWRRALSWEPENHDTLPLYAQFLTAFPADKAILAAQARAMARPRDKGAEDRRAGFASLNKGDLPQAAEQFQTALQVNDQDADATGGLGLVRLRQGHAAEAAALLDKAIHLAPDPDHARQWTTALSGARLAGDYNRVDRLIAAKRYDAAVEVIDKALEVSADQPGLLVKRADIDRLRGRTAQAAHRYRQILATDPANRDALQGLVSVLMAEGDLMEARRYAQRLPGAGHALLQKIQSATLQASAERSDAPGEKVTLLTSALTATPEDPWLRLHLAQALDQSGRHEQAREIMAPLFERVRSGTVEDRQAVLLFCASTNDFENAARILPLLPAARRPAAVRDLALRLQDREHIAMLPDEGDDARAALRSLAQQMDDPSGLRGRDIADRLSDRGRPALAVLFLRALTARAGHLTVRQRLAYAGSFLKLRDAGDASRLAGTLSGVVLSAEEKKQRNDLTAGLAVMRSDQLNAQGQQAHAYEALRPVLEEDPSSAPANLALSRLYEGRQETRKALAIAKAMVEQHPDNLDARLALVQYETARHEAEDSATQARWMMAHAPSDPRSWVAASKVAQAAGQWRESVEDLERAQDLRRQQIIRTTGDVEPAGNPFNQEPGDAASPSDPLLSQIATDEERLGRLYAPVIEVTPAFQERSGSGLTRLSRGDLQLKGSLPLGGGRLGATIDPTALASGDGSLNYHKGLWQTGTTAVDCPPWPASSSACYTSALSRRSAYGVGTDVSYAWRWMKADVGTSPLGFAVTNVLGGIELSPEVARHLRVKIVAERRAVTDSVLSYAGLHEGETWGGVTKNRGDLQLEYGTDALSLYGGGGASYLYGRNTQDNVSYEARGGGSARVYDNGVHRVHVGVDLNWFGYNNNQFLYTPGNGGYFSPQSFFSLTVPVRYEGHMGPWDWGLTGVIGYQAYHQRSTLLFANNAARQAAVTQYYHIAQACMAAQATAAAANATSVPCGGVSSTVLGQYDNEDPARSSSGISGGVDARMGYRVSRDFDLTGRLLYQKSGPWDQTGINVSLRYQPQEPR